MATDNEGKAGVGKVNVYEQMELATRFKITAVPTILVFKGGEVVGQAKGYKNKQDLQEMIDAAV